MEPSQQRAEFPWRELQVGSAWAAAELAVLLCHCAAGRHSARWAPSRGGVVEGRALDRASPGREGARAGGRGPWLPAFGRSDWPGVAAVADGPVGALRLRGGGWGEVGPGGVLQDLSPRRGSGFPADPDVAWVRTLTWPGSCATRAEAGYE